MTPGKGDAALVERLLAAGGHTRLVVAGGASAILITSPDDTGVQRERFRLVAIPNHKYRVEVAERGRWKNAGVSGLIEKVLPEALKKLR